MLFIIQNNTKALNSTNTKLDTDGKIILRLESDPLKSLGQ
jgi:hypothetical protein